MKTLHIITGLDDGGAEACLYRLCLHDDATRHSVVSLTDAGKYGSMLQSLGIQVTCLGMPRGRVTGSGLFRLWRRIRAARPDVVQTWMYHANLLGGLVAWLAGHRNVVWGIHNTTLVQGESSMATILVARAGGWLSRLVPRRIVCCAEKAVEVHAALGYDRRRLVFIPNGYDLSAFRPHPAAGLGVRAQLGLGGEAVIGFVARFDPQKDHETLLSALSLLHAEDIAPLCLLVGTGLDTENAALTRRVAALGLGTKVRLLGRRNDVAAIMNALDLHVMSSAFGEAFPNVLCEAMACGTPCVTTDVGDAGAIVGETGWVVPPRDPLALACAITEGLATLGQPGGPDQKAAARLRIERNFSIDRMVASYRSAWSFSA